MQMKNKYVISDIHGCLKTFKSLLTRLNFNKNDELYLLGDFIDRGPSSKGVIDFIWKLQESGYFIQCLKGNHDQMMLDARHSIELQRKWLINGGRTTIENFDVDHIQEIPVKYFEFFEGLPSYIEVDNYILVHAGFKFDMPNPFDEFHSMLWERDWYDNVNYNWLGDRIIVHGHTPITKNEIETLASEIRFNQYIDIDCGCVHLGKRRGLGFLACFILNENKIIFELNKDDERI